MILQSFKFLFSFFQCSVQSACPRQFLGCSAEFARPALPLCSCSSPRSHLCGWWLRRLLADRTAECGTLRSGDESLEHPGTAAGGMVTRKGWQPWLPKKRSTSPTWTQHHHPQHFAVDLALCRYHVGAQLPSKRVARCASSVAAAPPPRRSARWSASTQRRGPGSRCHLWRSPGSPATQHFRLQVLAVTMMDYFKKSKNFKFIGSHEATKPRSHEWVNVSCAWRVLGQHRRVGPRFCGAATCRDWERWRKYQGSGAWTKLPAPQRLPMWTKMVGEDAGLFENNMFAESVGFEPGWSVKIRMIVQPEVSRIIYSIYCPRKQLRNVYIDGNRQSLRRVAQRDGHFSLQGLPANSHALVSWAPLNTRKTMQNFLNLCYATDTILVQALFCQVDNVTGTVTCSLETLSVSCHCANSGGGDWFGQYRPKQWSGEPFKSGQTSGCKHTHTFLNRIKVTHLVCMPGISPSLHEDLHG